MKISPYGGRINAQRLAAIERPRRVFRWTAAGAATAVVVIVGAVSHEIPGRSNAATTARSSPPASSPPNGSPTSTGGGAPGAAPLSPPATAPTPTRQAPAAVSGGTGW